MNSDVKWSLTFRYIVAVILFILVIAFLVYARVAVRVIAIAAFVAYLIDPAVVYLSTRTRLTRTTAVNLVFFSALILLVGIPATLAPIFYDEAQIVAKDVVDLAAQLQAMLANPIRLGGLVAKIVIEGEGEWEIGPETAFYSPIGVKHRVENIGDEPLRIVWVYCPPLPAHCSDQ